MNYLISTDLDGTLLDHHDYSWHAAQEALIVCKEQNVPVILNTSKTLAEVRELQQTIKLEGPMVVENGSALILPMLSFEQSINLEYLETLDIQYNIDNDKGEIQIIFGVARKELLKFIDRIRQEYSWQFTGFNDWSVAEIAERTGLTLETASNASDKLYSEPLIWSDSAEELGQFTELAVQQGFKILRGGRFIHLQGETNKATPLVWLRQHLISLYPLLENDSGISHFDLICLGDNHNDVDMLNIADYPVCVRSPVANFPTLNTNKKIIFTEEEGPLGWNKAVLDIIAN